MTDQPLPQPAGKVIDALTRPMGMQIQYRLVGKGWATMTVVLRLNRSRIGLSVRLGGVAQVNILPIIGRGFYKNVDRTAYTLRDALLLLVVSSTKLLLECGRGRSVGVEVENVDSSHFRRPGRCLTELRVQNLRQSQARVPHVFSVIATDFG